MEKMEDIGKAPEEQSIITGLLNKIMQLAYTQGSGLNETIDVSRKLNYFNEELVKSNDGDVMPDTIVGKLEAIISILEANYLKISDLHEHLKRNL